MKVVIQFDIGADIIEIPEVSEKTLKEYQNRFLAWLSDKSNDHEYWVIIDDEKYGLSYRSCALVEWLNQFVYDNDEAVLLDQGLYEWDTTLPRLFF